MARDRPLTILILYSHPLLGEGVTRLLAAEPGLTVTPVAIADPAAVEAALAAGPDVIVLERGDPLQAIDVLKAAPDALLIDIGLGPGPAFSYHRERLPARPEGLLRAIRHLRAGAPWPRSSPSPRVHPPGRRSSAEAPVRPAQVVPGGRSDRIG